MRNPFTYPAGSGFEWLTVLASSPPGTLLWLPLIDPVTSELHIGFALREESDIIENLPSTKAKTAIIEWRFGVLEMRAPSGKTVAFIEVIIRTPGGICEANINMLHLTSDMIESIEAESPVVVMFVGDSGRVERQMLFANAEPLRQVVEVAQGVYDAVKKHFEETSSVEEIWNRLGRKS
jgi:hypothetical protein